MNIIKEPYDPNWFRIEEEHTGYTHIYEKFLIIQTGKSKVSVSETIVPLIILAASIGLSFLWLPILLVNVLTILVWVIAPSLRPVQQISKRYLVQEGQRSATTILGPSIDWGLYKNSELYASAVHEWLEALRCSHDPQINQSDWSKYFREIAKLVPKIEASFHSTKPDFEKIKILKELMQ